MQVTNELLLHFYKCVFSISIAAAHCGALSSPKGHGNNSG